MTATLPLSDPAGYRTAHDHLEHERDNLLGQVAYWRGITDRLLLDIARDHGTTVDTERIRLGLPVRSRPREPRTRPGRTETAPGTTNAISGYVDPPTTPTTPQRGTQR